MTKSTLPKISQCSPYEFTAEQGKKYAWCACGLSKNQPFCDGLHSGTGFKPLVFTAEASGVVYLCGCKHTSTPPFCDGSHNTLTKEQL